MALRWQQISMAAAAAMFVAAVLSVAQAQPYSAEDAPNAPPRAAPTTPVWTVPPPLNPQQPSSAAPAQTATRYAVMGDVAPPAPPAQPIAPQAVTPPRAADAPNYSIMNGTYRPADYGPLGGAYTLGTGDKLDVTVYGETDLSGSFEVDSMGDVRLPLIGQVRAAGLTVQDFEQSVTRKLSAGYLLNPRVNAEVTAYRPFFIMGEVNKPGQYAYVNAMNVVTAVALAGGYTYRADDSDVYVRRDGQTQEVERPADATTRILPGDIVRVGERFF